MLFVAFDAAGFKVATLRLQNTAIPTLMDINDH